MNRVSRSFFMRSSLTNLSALGGWIEASFPGDHGEGETPVPISNTAVKPLRGDGTMLVTAWESSTLPGFIFTHLNLLPLAHL